MLDIIKMYKASLIFMVFALGLSYLDSGTIGLYSVVILMVLEVSLSFDNAVVNAKDLGKLSANGRQWFLLWGFLIAVIGMRLLFPILIVSASTGLPPIWFGTTDNVAMIALYDPQRYAQLLDNTHTLVAGFGGAFLMMVGLSFFFGKEKDEHWIIGIEHLFHYIGKLNFISIPIIEAVVTAVIACVFSRYIPGGAGFFCAALIGIAAFMAVNGFKEYLEAQEDDTSASLVNGAIKGGLATLIFMEVRDASFSFDGVIGAFAITNMIGIIVLGLATGALFVRQMTLHLVESGTIAKYRYLENGALWSILALSITMMVGPIVHLPEIVTGSLGVLFIGLSLISSIFDNRKQANSIVA